MDHDLKEQRMRRLVMGEYVGPEGQRDKPTPWQKLAGSPGFDGFVMGVIILYIALLATDGTDIVRKGLNQFNHWMINSYYFKQPLDEQSAKRQNAYLFCDVRISHYLFILFWFYIVFS